MKVQNARWQAVLLGSLLGLGACEPPPGGPTAPPPNAEPVDHGGGELLLANGLAPAAGGAFACAILEGGAVKCWGRNDFGQLGLGDANNRGDNPGEMGNALGYVPLGRPAIALTAGGWFACALLNNNQIKCWGMGGLLGNGSPSNRGDSASAFGELDTVNLGTGRSAVAVAAGNTHACAILDNGAVKCWGGNVFGELGLGDLNSRGGSPGQMGDALPAVYLGAGHTAKAISCGLEISCVILDTIPGPVKCWGSNDSGELGLGDFNNRGGNPGDMQALGTIDLGAVSAKAISSAGSHTCALLNNNTVKCWGRNAEGELGLGDTNFRGDQSGEMGTALPAVDLGTGVTALSVNAMWSGACAITSAGLKCWGASFSGELGLNDTVTRGDGPGEMGNNLPTVFLGTGRSAQLLATGQGDPCVVLDTRQLKCWGANNFGQLGLGDVNNRGDNAGEMAALPIVPLGTRSVKVLANGGYHTCAVFNDGTVKCWGRNDWGQLGQGDTTNRGDNAGEMGASLPPVDLGSGLVVSALATGHRHTCALFTTGQVKCWGYNGEGELALGDVNNRGDQPNEMGANLPFLNFGTGITATGIFTGAYHTCALLSNATVKCWGENQVGQLGLGDTPARGDDAGETPNNLPAVNLGTNFTVASIAGGYYHSCARSTTGQVKCWGYNLDGELGVGSTAHKGDGPNEMGNNLVAVDLGTGLTASALSMGGYHSCALLSNNQVKCWGYNGHGELGVGDANSRGDGANEMGTNLPTVNLGSGFTATAISMGGFQSCALLNTGGVKCWGFNYSGGLGTGDTRNRGSNAGEMGDQLGVVNLGDRIVTRVATSGDGAVCVKLDTNEVQCWGLNVYGELGLGDTVNRLGPTSVVDLGPDTQDLQ